MAGGLGGQGAGRCAPRAFLKDPRRKAAFPAGILFCICYKILRPPAASPCAIATNIFTVQTGVRDTWIFEEKLSLF